MEPVRPAQRLERPPQPPGRGAAAGGAPVNNVDEEDDYSDVSSELESEVISQNFRMLPWPFPAEGGPGPSLSTSPCASHGRGVSPLASEQRTLVSGSSLTAWSGAHVIQNGEQMPWTAGNGLRTFDKLRANTAGSPSRGGVGGGGVGTPAGGVAQQFRPPVCRGAAAAQCELTVENLERIREAVLSPINLPVESWKADAQAARRTPPAVIAVAHARSDSAAHGLDTSLRPTTTATSSSQAPRKQASSPTKKHTPVSAATTPKQPPPFPSQHGSAVARPARPATTTTPAERTRAAAASSAVPERRKAGAAAAAARPDTAGTGAPLAPTAAPSPEAAAAPAQRTASPPEAHTNAAATTATTTAASLPPRRSSKRTTQAAAAAPASNRPSTSNKPAAAAAAAATRTTPAGPPPPQPERSGVPGAPSQYTSGGRVVQAARRLPVTAHPAHSGTMPPSSYAAVAADEAVSTPTPAATATTARAATANAATSPREDTRSAAAESLTSCSVKTVAPERARALVIRRSSSEDAQTAVAEGGGGDGPPAPSSAATATDAPEEGCESRLATSQLSSRNTRGTGSDVEDSEPVLRLHVTPLAAPSVPSRSPKLLSTTVSAMHITPNSAAMLPPALVASPNGNLQGLHAHPSTGGAGAHVPQHRIRPAVNTITAKPLDAPVIPRKLLAVVTVTAPNDEEEEAKNSASGAAAASEAAAEEGAASSNANRSLSATSPTSTLPLVNGASRRPHGGGGNNSNSVNAPTGGPVRRCSSRDTFQSSSREASPSVGSTQPFLSLRQVTGSVGGAGGGAANGLHLARHTATGALAAGVGAAGGTSASAALSRSRTASADSCSSRSTPSFLQDAASGQAGTPVRSPRRQTAVTPFALDRPHSARHAAPVPAAPVTASPSAATAAAPKRGRRASGSGERALTSAPRRANGDGRIDLTERPSSTTNSPPHPHSLQPPPQRRQSHTHPQPPPPSLLHIGGGKTGGAPLVERPHTLEPLDTANGAAVAAAGGPPFTALTPLSAANANSDSTSPSPPSASADIRKAAWKASRQVPALQRPLPERRATVATLTATAAAGGEKRCGRDGEVDTLDGKGGGAPDTPTLARVRPGPVRPRSYSVPPGSIGTKMGATSTATASVSPAAAAPIAGAAASHGARSTSPPTKTGNAAAAPRRDAQGRTRASPALFTPPPPPPSSTTSQPAPPPPPLRATTSGTHNGAPANTLVNPRSPLDDFRLSLRSPLTPTARSGKPTERTSYLQTPATTTTNSTASTTPSPAALSPATALLPPALASRSSNEPHASSAGATTAATTATGAGAASAEPRPGRLPSLKGGALSPLPPPPPPPATTASAAPPVFVPAPTPACVNNANAVDRKEENSLTMESVGTSGAISIAPARRRTVTRVRDGSVNSDTGVESRGGSRGGGGDVDREAPGHARQRVVPPVLDAEDAGAAARPSEDDKGGENEGREGLRRTSSRRAPPARRRRSTDMQLPSEEAMRTV